jgi:hypothetical protein
MFQLSAVSSPPHYQTGERVNVLYNPENPVEAQIDRGIGNYWVAVLLGFIGALFVMAGLYSVRKRIR